MGWLWIEDRYVLLGTGKYRGQDGERWYRKGIGQDGTGMVQDGTRKGWIWARYDW
jgi:hypothetical protein